MINNELSTIDVKLEQTLKYYTYLEFLDIDEYLHKLGYKIIRGTNSGSLAVDAKLKLY